MTRAVSPRQLDVAAFAAVGGKLAGRQRQGEFARLAELTEGRGAGREIGWELRGEQRHTGGRAQPWLHLQGDALLAMTCQRCLEPVDVPLAVRRSYRFVADEETAAREDEEAEEEVLALQRRLDVLELLEDELLLDAPAVPRHETCPGGDALLRGLAPAAEDRPGTHRPFAALGRRGPHKAN